MPLRFNKEHICQPVAVVKIVLEIGAKQSVDVLVLAEELQGLSWTVEE